MPVCKIPSGGSLALIRVRNTVARKLTDKNCKIYFQMKLDSPNSKDLLAICFLIIQTWESQAALQRQDPLLQVVMANPLYREQLLDPPDRAQDTLLKILRESGSDLQVQNLLPPAGSLPRDNTKELLVAPEYKQDPLLRQLLSKYHEDFLNVLEPPQEHQGFKADPNIFQPPPYKQDPLLRQLSGNVNDKIQLQAPAYKQDPLLRVLPNKPRTESFQGLLKAPLHSPTKEAMLNLMRKEKERLMSLKADRILNLVSSQSTSKRGQSLSKFTPPVYAQDPLHRQLANTPSSQQYDFLTPPASEVNFQSLLEDLTSAVETFQRNELQKQQVKSLPLTKNVQGGVDFSLATLTEDGRLCVIKEDTIESLEKEPVLKCSHSSEEKCHDTYITFFTPSQEEECEDNFEKKCQITFRKEASTETIQKCYKPLTKVCNGQGPRECQTEYETSCSTRYVEQSPGKFVGDTKCEKIPLEVCGQGCVTEEGDEECHQKNVDILVDVPEEICDITPQKTCRHVTKLVPSLRPTKECTTVPKQVCNLNFEQGKVVKNPLRTEWCLESDSENVQPRTEKFTENSFTNTLDSPAFTQGLVKFRQ